MADKVGNHVISVQIDYDAPNVTPALLEKLLGMFVSLASGATDPGYVTGGISKESYSEEEGNGRA